jgi:hypothetical protein
MRTTVIVILLSIVLLSTTALADVPGQINYQGTLTDAGGVSLDTTVAMIFTIYDDSTGGSAKWTETQPAVQVSAGIFNVLLGSVNSLSNTVFNQASRWLGVQLGGDPELTPRQQIAAVGYAFCSAESDTADYARSAGGGSGGDDGDWTISGDDMYAAVDGKIGVGTAAPVYKLDVKGSISGSDTTANSYGVIGDSTFGVYGYCQSGDAVLGSSFNSRGVAGYSTNSAGVYGWSSTSNAGHFDGNVKMTGFELPTGASSGHVLTSDGSGVGTWQAPAAVSDGDWTISGSDMYSAVSGNVGVGTGSPAAHLHVSSIGNTELRIDNDDWKSTLSFYQSTTNTGYLMKDDDNGRLNVSADGSTDHVTILESNGRVGIGTLTPFAQLHVENPSSVNFSKAIYGISTSAVSGEQLNGVMGETQSPTLVNPGAGVCGWASNSTGASFGVRGEAACESGTGVFAWATSSAGTTYGLYARSDSPDGYAVYGQKSFSGHVGYLGGPDYGVYGEHTSGTYGCIGEDHHAVEGLHPDGYYGSIADSLCGVMGKSPDGTSWGRLGMWGHGVYAYRNGSVGEAMRANMHHTGTSPGSGHAFIVDFQCDTSGWNYDAAKSAILAYSPSWDGIQDQNYLFGVTGDQYSENPRRGGGVLGVYDHSRWGCLAYTNSGGVKYGAYFTSHTDGPGKSSVGFGSSAELLGGWVRGDLYGLYTSGKRYGSYTDGNAFCNGYQAMLHDVGERRRAATFATTSMNVDVYAHGAGRLAAGRAEISFDKEFVDLISREIPVTVSVTPIGLPAGLVCITRKTHTSFAVELLEIPGIKGGTKDVSFDWIAIGRRKGFESRPEIPAELARDDFDADMRDFAFNEGDLEDQAKPMWHDGASLRWDTPPSAGVPLEKRARVEEDRRRYRELESEATRGAEESRRRMMETREKRESQRRSSGINEAIQPARRTPDRGEATEAMGRQ